MVERSEARHVQAPESSDDDAPSGTVNTTASLGDVEPSDVELQEVGAEAQPLKATEMPEGMLARYFRDMSGHSVMSPDEENRAAREFYDAEVDRWRAFLAWPPMLPIIERCVMTEMVAAQVEHPLPEFAKLEKLLKDYRSNRSKLDRKGAARWTTCASSSRSPAASTTVACRCRT
jgi:hypothetical protein